MLISGSVILGASITMQLGYTPGWLLFENLAAYVLFYCAHWQTYVCGTLKFGKCVLLFSLVSYTTT